MKAIQKTKSKKSLSERVTAMEGDPRGALATWGRRMAGRTRSIFIVLRHGILSLYSYIRKFVPWRSRTYIQNLRHVRIAGLTSSFLLGLLALAIIIPLYNVSGTEDTEAATGTAIDSSITFTSTRASATVDLTPTSASGTFASSTSGTTDAAFSITTTNSQGYELKIKSTSGTVLKPTTTTSDSDGLSTITTSGITSSSFANNTWGYLPSYYNSTSNTTKYYPATTSDVTLRKTTSANTTAHNYTIGLGAKVNLTKTSGTYTLGGNKGSLVLTYVANPTAYSITFNKGNTTDAVSNMPYSSTNNVLSSTVSATSVTITDGVPTRTGYDFKGWCTVLPTTTDKVDTCKNSAGTTGATYNATGVTSWTYGIDRTSSNNVTLYALWSAKTYTITVNNGGNTTVGGTGTYKYGDTITLTATPTTNTTCATYGTPSWTKNSGEGTLNATSGTSVTFTVGLGNATITATSAKTDVKQTITLSRSNANSISIAGTSYTSSSVSLNCGTYNITGTFPTGYKFSSWSRANGVAVTSTSTLATTMTVSGAGTLTLNGTPNTYSLAITFAGSGVSSVQVRTASGTSGTLMGTVSSSGDSVSGLAYNSTYYLYPVFSSGYEFSSWAKTGSTGTLSSTTTSNPTFTMGAGDGAVTITGKSSCSTITFKTSNASSIVFNGTSYTNNQSTCIAKGTYSIYGTYATKYAWKSWSATAGTFGNQSYQNTTYTVTSNATITLTGQSVTLAIQNLSSGSCTTTARPVYDTRDNSVYWVQQLADGKCWMLDNLAFDAAANVNSITTSSTNTSQDGINALKSGGSYPYSTNAISYTWGSTNPYTDARINVSGTFDSIAYTKDSTLVSMDAPTTPNHNNGAYGPGQGKVGAYYNYCAASGGTYCYSTRPSGDASYDICPAGWRMPTGGWSGEYRTLYNDSAIGSDAAKYRNALSTPLSGRFSYGSAYDQGSNGRFWSSTRNDNTNMYTLSVNSSDVVPLNYEGSRNLGYSVRCVLK